MRLPNLSAANLIRGWPGPGKGAKNLGEATARWMDIQPPDPSPELPPPVS
jgi:hypothetical protein